MYLLFPYSENRLVLLLHMGLKKRLPNYAFESEDIFLVPIFETKHELNTINKLFVSD